MVILIFVTGNSCPDFTKSSKRKSEEAIQSIFFSIFRHNFNRTLGDFDFEVNLNGITNHYHITQKDEINAKMKNFYEL